MLSNWLGPAARSTPNSRYVRVGARVGGSAAVEADKKKRGRKEQRMLVLMIRSEATPAKQAQRLSKNQITEWSAVCPNPHLKMLLQFLKPTSNFTKKLPRESAS